MLRRSSDTGLDALELDAPLVEQVLHAFIVNEVRKQGFERVVVGLSGGIDSALSCMLAAKALGPSQVLAIRMPYSSSSADSLEDAQAVVDATGVECVTIDISPQIDAYFSDRPAADRMSRGNKMARERMAVLYDHSSIHSALVLGTSNKTELLLGYGTIHGDMASAINPIGDLYKTQVRQISRHVGVPKTILEKAPSADLWSGQTDEEEMGFTYEAVDQILFHMVDRRVSPSEIGGFEPSLVRRVAEQVRRSHFKRTLPIIAKISHRTIGRDFRYARDWGA